MRQEIIFLTHMIIMMTLMKNNIVEEVKEFLTKIGLKLGTIIYIPEENGLDEIWEFNVENPSGIQMLAISLYENELLMNDNIYIDIHYDGKY